MAAPSTVDEFVELIRKSAVLDEPRLSSYVQKLRSDPASPKELSGIAGLFVRDGLLTYFQAEQFLQGRWKRFTIGKYKVLEKIGSGGMGQVFLCEHKLMRRRVAVKVLPTQKAADPSSLDRFYREARAVAALDHINIVRAYDIDQDDNLHFLVMEYVDGASMQDMIRKSKRLDVTRACHYMYWSAIGLQHAHASGLIHRDIKPGNILVDRTGVVKILDLGLARFFNDDEDLLTKKYDESVLGTADYLAPEQAIDSHTVDGRADIYSLGATFYFLLSGNPPFADGSIAQKLLWHQTRIPKPIRELRPEVPADVAAILEKMMAKKPEDRYQTPAQLAEALLPFTQTPIGPPPEEEMPRLSAAAQGTASGPVSISAAPRTIVTAPRTPMPVHGGAGRAPVTPEPKGGSSDRGRPATAVAEADTQKNRPVPVVEPIPDSTPGTPIWEVISAETANAGRADTDRTKRDNSSRRVKNKPVEEKPVEVRKAPKSEKRQGKKTQSSMGLIVLLVAGVILIGGGPFAAYWFGFRDKSKPSIPGATEPRTLYLTKNPGGAALHYSSLQKAVEEFKTGDTIVIKDDEWEEIAAATRTKGLILKAAEGKQVIWKVPSGLKNPKEQVLLTLSNTEGAHISGIAFDCGGLAKHAMRITGQCPDLILENVTMRNATDAALSIHDCIGVDNRPATIRQCWFANPGGRESKSAILFSADAPMRGSKNVQIHNCTVEGPFTGAAFQFEGTAGAIEIKHCRVWNVGNGVWFRKSTTGQPIWQVNIVGNTFHTTTGPTLRFEDVNQLKAKPEMRISLAQNFFAGTKMVALFEGGNLAGSKFFVAEPNSNVRKSGVPPGNMPIPMAEANADLPVSPADRKNFLMYPKSSPLFTAANGKPAGVPPE